MPPTTEPVPVSGDLDGDWVITVSDVITLNRYLLGAGTLPKEAYASADLLADGVIDTYDLALLKRAVLSQN